MNSQSEIQEQIPSINMEQKNIEKKIEFFEPRTKEKVQDPLKNAVTFTDNLFTSDRHTHMCLKAIFGVLSGFFSGGVLYVVLVFSFGYPYDLAGYISIGCTVLSCLALALSVHARCIMVLVIPSLFTSRGRVAILAVIFGLLLSRPIANISNNAGEVSRSMACSTELFHNQSYSLRQQLQIPIEQIKSAMQGQAEQIKKIGRVISLAFEPIYKAIIAVKNGVKLAADALDTASQECDRVIGKVYSDCVSGINSAYRDCYNTLNDVKKYVPGFDVTPICKILDIDDICVIVKPDFLCSPVRGFDQLIQQAAGAMDNLVNEIEKWFEFNVNTKAAAGQLYNASKTVQELIYEVKSALTEKQITFTTVIEYFNKLLALTLILLIIQSYIYLKSYLSKNEYDNIYLTAKFRRLDHENEKLNEQTVLPLRKKEKTMYINTLSPRMTRKEKQKSLMGLAILVLHMLLSALIVFIDHVLYYILYLVRRYGQVNVEFTGQSTIDFRVKGGAMATFINTFISNINIQNTYEANYNTTLCLPDPTIPNNDDIQVLAAVYFVAVLFVFMQTYGMRWNHRICAFYYPEQEADRIAFLHKKILFNRKKQDMFRRQHVNSLKRQKLAEEQMSLKRLCCCLLPGLKADPTDIKFCMQCGKNQSTSTKLTVCKNPKCGAIYCEECHTDFRKTCPICRL